MTDERLKEVKTEQDENEAVEVENEILLDGVLDVPEINIKIRAKNVYLTVYPAGHLDGGASDE